MATAIGREGDARLLRSHFNSHRPRQAPPRQRPPAEVRALIDSLRERERAILDFACRVQALDAGVVAAALYWPGEESARSRGAAHKNALLGLRRLWSADLLYRVHPEQLEGPAMRPLPTPLFFPGHTSRAYMRLTLESPPPQSTVRELRQLPARGKIRRAYQENQLLYALFAHLPERHGARRGINLADGVAIELAVTDCYDRRFARLRFQDPLQLADRIAAAGLIGLRVLVPGSGPRVVPCFHYRMSSSERPKAIAAELAAHVALARSGALCERLPQLERGRMAVLLLSTAEASAITEVERELAALHLTPMPAVYAVDETSLASSGLSATWRRLTDGWKGPLSEALVGHSQTAPRAPGLRVELAQTPAGRLWRP